MASVGAGAPSTSSRSDDGKTPAVGRSISWAGGLEVDDAAKDQLEKSEPERQPLYEQSEPSWGTSSVAEVAPVAPALKRSNSAVAVTNPTKRTSDFADVKMAHHRSFRPPMRSGSAAGSSLYRVVSMQSARHLETRVQKVDILASYSPRMLIERFVDDHEPPTAASERAFHGAVVFVDVSGFTALSEALSLEHGPIEGAELLNLYINAYMRKLIEYIDGAGGDIIKFAGDAMQVVWPHKPQQAEGHSVRASDSEEEEEEDESHEHEMGRKVLEAARCCLAMLSDLSGFSPVKGVALKLHIGVGAGRMVAYTVGGHLKKWSVHACVLREHTLVAPNA